MEIHTFLYFNIAELSSFKDNNLTHKQAQKKKTQSEISRENVYVENIL